MEPTGMGPLDLVVAESEIHTVYIPLLFNGMWHDDIGKIQY